jgi:hypothetical protein
MRSAADAANLARRELERVRADIEVRQEELLRLKDAADSRAVHTKRELEQARGQLDDKRLELERVAASAERRVREARAEMARIEAQRLQAVAQAGIAQGLAQQRQPFVPNAAAVAAASAMGRSRPYGRGTEAPGAPGAVTPEGDLLRGQAELARAEGDLAVDTSIAAINQQTARAMAMENRMRAVENFYEARRLNREQAVFEAQPTVTMAQTVRIAAAGVPPRATPLQLDPLTGDIVWPEVLRDFEFQDRIDDVERRFSERASAGGCPGTAHRRLLNEALDDLSDRLRANVSRYPAGKYGIARTFLDSLRREYDMPLAD